jgi:hypothetical protein
MRWTLWRQVRQRDPGKVKTGFPIRITLKQSSPDENAAAYGEVVWSWRRDPGATLARNFPAGNGGKKGRFPGESTYKP